MKNKDYNELEKCISHKVSAARNKNCVKWMIKIPNTGKHIMYFAILSMDGKRTYEYITYKNSWSILDGCKSKYYENTIEHIPRRKRGELE